MSRFSLDAVNAMDGPTFADAFAGIYEKTPWVAERTSASGPWHSVTELHAALETTVSNGSDAEKLALINAHPDLAGRAALAKRLTDESNTEQAAAGLDTLSEAELARFTKLNDAYKDRFGFPFIMAVRGANKHKILAAFQHRITNSVGEELAEALHQIGKIAWMRLLEKIEPATTGKLTCHVLDTAHGSPAAGMGVVLTRLDPEPTEIERFTTNDDGRLNGPALSGADLLPGTYEWVFDAGTYFAGTSARVAGRPFLDLVPIRFAIDNPEAHYHVPLLVSPWSFSTYRGS